MVSIEALFWIFEGIVLLLVVTVMFQIFVSTSWFRRMRLRELENSVVEVDSE